MGWVWESATRSTLTLTTGRSTHYGAMIAFPMYLWTIRSTTAANMGGLPGVHTFYGGSEWEYFQPIRPGDVISASYRPYSVVEKPTSSYAGHVVIQSAQTLYVNGRGQAMAKGRAWSVRTERRAARERDVYKGVEKPRYSDEDLQDIWDAYDKEQIRGAEPRHWEDVTEGEVLPPLVRGPLRVVDIIFGAGRFDAFNMGAGGSPGGSHYHRWQSFKKHAAFAEPDPETGVPDHPHRGHWEDTMPKIIALPGIYDLGPQRGSWARPDCHELDGRPGVSAQVLQRTAPFQHRRGHHPGWREKSPASGLRTAGEWWSVRPSAATSAATPPGRLGWRSSCHPGPLVS